jgi:hypothetical protein
MKPSPTTPLCPEYRLHDGDIVDSHMRRITVSGNAGICQLLNELDQLKRKSAQSEKRERVALEISEEDEQRLEELGRSYFVVKGHKPLSVSETVHRVIDGLWSEVRPEPPIPLREDQGR